MSSPKNEQTPILTSGSVRENILKALELQKKRFQWIGKDIQNGDAPIDRELSCFRIGSNEKKWLEKLQQRMALSYRGYHKILRISRTIADIEGSEVVKMDHLREAWSLRCPPNYTTSSLA